MTTNAADKRYNSSALGKAARVRYNTKYIRKLRTLCLEKLGGKCVWEGCGWTGVMYGG